MHHTIQYIRCIAETCAISSKKEKTNIHQCHLYKHVFLTNQNLTAHLDKCEAPCICKLCQKSFSSKSSLEWHFDMCSKSKVACLFCDYRCVSDAQLADHTKRNHAKQPTFSCSHCNNVHGSNDKRLSHMQMCHSNILK